MVPCRRIGLAFTIVSLTVVSAIQADAQPLYEDCGGTFRLMAEQFRKMAALCEQEVWRLTQKEAALNYQCVLGKASQAEVDAARRELADAERKQEFYSQMAEDAASGNMRISCQEFEEMLREDPRLRRPEASGSKSGAGHVYPGQVRDDREAKMQREVEARERQRVATEQLSRDAGELLDVIFDGRKERAQRRPVHPDKPGEPKPEDYVPESDINEGFGEKRTGHHEASDNQTISCDSAWEREFVRFFEYQDGTSLDTPLASESAPDFVRSDWGNPEFWDCVDEYERQLWRNGGALWTPGQSIPEGYDPVPVEWIQQTTTRELPAGDFPTIERRTVISRWELWPSDGVEITGLRSRETLEFFVDSPSAAMTWTTVDRYSATYAPRTSITAKDDELPWLTRYGCKALEWIAAVKYGVITIESGTVWTSWGEKRVGDGDYLEPYRPRK